MGLISRVSSRTHRFLVVLRVFNPPKCLTTKPSKPPEPLVPSPTQPSAVPSERTVTLCSKVTQEGYLSLMDDSGDVRDDLHCNHDNELLDEIKKKFDAGDEMMICVLKAMGKEQPVAIKAIASK